MISLPVDAKTWATIAMVGALSSSFLAIHRDRNALGWLFAGAALPGISLFLLLLERHRTSWRTVASGACLVLLVSTAIACIELFRARQRVVTLQEDHVQRTEYCIRHRMRVHMARTSLDGKFPRTKDHLVGELKRVLADDVMRLCNIDGTKYDRLMEDADWCWIESDDALCYRYAIHALDDDLP